MYHRPSNAQSARELMHDDDDADATQETRHDRQRQEVGNPPQLQQTDRHHHQAGDDRGRGDQLEVQECVETGARRIRTTAKSGAMVESAPTDTMGFDPTKTKTSVAVMKAIIAMKAGTPARLRSRELLGDGDGEQGDAGEHLTRVSCFRVTPPNVWRSPATG